MSKDLIQQAIDFANSPEHNGAGWSLRIVLANDSYFEVDVSNKEGYPYILRRREPGTKYDGEIWFVNPEIVQTVVVLW